MTPPSPTLQGSARPQRTASFGASGGLRPAFPSSLGPNQRPSPIYAGTGASPRFAPGSAVLTPTRLGRAAPSGSFSLEEEEAPVTPAGGARRPVLPPLMIEMPSRRNIPLPLPAVETTTLTRWHIFYIFGMQGLGSMVLDAGINYALHLLIFARGAALWAFVPATLAGDFAMTAIVQCAMTWVIASQLQFLDVRNGLVRPLIVRCLPVQSEVFSFDSPEARRIREAGAGCNPPGPCADVEDWADPSPQRARPLSASRSLEAGRPTALRRWVRWLARNDGIMGAPELDDVPAGAALCCARARIIRRQFARGAVWSLPFLLVLWPISVGVSYALYGETYAPGPLPVAILAAYGGLLGLLTTPLVAAITLHSAACDAAASLALDTVDPLTPADAAGAMPAETGAEKVPVGLGRAPSARSAGSAANHDGGEVSDVLLVNDEDGDGPASMTPLALLPLKDTGLPLQHQILLLPPPAIDVTSDETGGGLHSGRDMPPRLALLTVSDTNDPVMAAFSPMTVGIMARHGGGGGGSAHYPLNSARSAGSSSGAHPAGATSAAAAASASPAADSPRSEAAAVVRVASERSLPRGGAEPLASLTSQSSSRVLSALHSPGQHSQPPLLPAHHPSHPPLHPPPGASAHPHPPLHPHHPLHLLTSHGGGSGGGGDSPLTVGSTHSQHHLAPQGSGRFSPVYALRTPPLPLSPHGVTQGGAHGHSVSGGDFPLPHPPSSPSVASERTAADAGALPLSLHGTPPRAAPRPPATPAGRPALQPAMWQPLTPGRGAGPLLPPEEGAVSARRPPYPMPSDGHAEALAAAAAHAHTISPVGGVGLPVMPALPLAAAAQLPLGMAAAGSGRVPPVIVSGAGPRPLVAARARVGGGDSGGGGSLLARPLSHPLLVPDGGGSGTQRRVANPFAPAAAPPPLPLPIAPGSTDEVVVVDAGLPPGGTAAAALSMHLHAHTASSDTSLPGALKIGRSFALSPPPLPPPTPSSGQNRPLQAAQALAAADAAAAAAAAASRPAKADSRVVTTMSPLAAAVAAAALSGPVAPGGRRGSLPTAPRVPGGSSSGSGSGAIPSGLPLGAQGGRRGSAVAQGGYMMAPGAAATAAAGAGPRRISVSTPWLGSSTSSGPGTATSDGAAAAAAAAAAALTSPSRGLVAALQRSQQQQQHRDDAGGVSARSREGGGEGGGGAVPPPPPSRTAGWS